MFMRNVYTVEVDVDGEIKEVTIYRSHMWRSLNGFKRQAIQAAIAKNIEEEGTRPESVTPIRYSQDFN
ncbi:hypothetical protein [Alkalicoccus chagannorensis]|uniref:hypothetical protein n=1 Tax=Alkalicoccus chagannorensis TaxID=427072 RepID=UPI00040343E4|nr:hypothetical protein [Alkalicoccus chagannorensis]